MHRESVRRTTARYVRREAEMCMCRDTMVTRLPRKTIQIGGIRALRDTHQHATIPSQRREGLSYRTRLSPTQHTSLAFTLVFCSVPVPPSMPPTRPTSISLHQVCVVLPSPTINDNRATLSGGNINPVRLVEDGDQRSWLQPVQSGVTNRCTCIRCRCAVGFARVCSCNRVCSGWHCTYAQHYT